MLKHVGHHRTSSSTIKSSSIRHLEDRSPSKSPSVASVQEDYSLCNRTRCGAESPSSESPLLCSRIICSKDNVSCGTPSSNSSPSSSPSFSRVHVLNPASKSPSHSRSQSLGNPFPSCTRIQFSANISPSRTSSRIQLSSEDSPSKSLSSLRAKHPSNSSIASSPSPSPVPNLGYASKDNPQHPGEKADQHRASSPSETKGHQDNSTSSLRTRSPVENPPSEVPSEDAPTSTLRPQPDSPSPSEPKSQVTAQTPPRTEGTSCCISSECFRRRRSPSDVDASPDLARKTSPSGEAGSDSSLEDSRCAESFTPYDGYEEAVERPMTLPRRAHRNSVGKASKARLLNKSYCNLHTPCKSSSSLREQTMSPVKVYMRNMKPDIKYTTMSLSSSTTCRELILMLLAKFRLRHRDPNLFYVRMEVVVRSPGGDAPARRLLVLDDHACPAELQQCRPRGEARFSVGVRRGGLLRVHDSILMPGSQYKSLLVSYRTTAEELVQLLLNCYNSKEPPTNYEVHEVNKNPYSDRPLQPDEFPLLVQSEWPKAARHNYAFVLRRNVSRNVFLRAKTTWRHSLAHSSTDTESDPEDHSATRAPNSLKNMFMRTSGTDPIAVSLGPSGDLLFSPSSSFLSRSSSDSGFSSPSSSRSSTSSDTPTPPSSPPRPCTSPRPSHVLTLSLESCLTFTTKVSPEHDSDSDISSETTILSSSSHSCDDVCDVTDDSPSEENSSCDIVSISSLKGTFITIPDARASPPQSRKPIRSLNKQCAIDESSFYI
ncbi:uncharacterized protein LOC122246902 [Penaeus japonicus]|uniref:uncharacterized protein LOC122246902 n=1 Tax=Penaeus japonicus TaxID=27405 RepID=UPI001C714541|nr:uncharacterized protein LOC122246902 [Penaeus japonicus]